MADDETVEFEDARCIGQTDKAIKVRLADRERPIWVPQSVVHDDSEVYKLGQTGKLVLPEWFALKEGLI
jgi:4-hydroxy-3-methylbut-2-enyl diphosphate reductase IspH